MGSVDHIITQCYLLPDTNELAPPNPSQTSWRSICLPRRYGRLSRPRWLVAYRDSLPARRRSPIQVRTNRVQYRLTSLIKPTPLTTTLGCNDKPTFVSLHVQPHSITEHAGRVDSPAEIDLLSEWRILTERTPTTRITRSTINYYSPGISVVVSDGRNGRGRNWPNGANPGLRCAAPTSLIRAALTSHVTSSCSGITWSNTTNLVSFFYPTGSTKLVAA